MQARGLKQQVGKPYTGKNASRLMQARGLKHTEQRAHIDLVVSRLMQARGLKPLLPRCAPPSQIVAPHAGAWIETQRRHLRMRSRDRRASCRRVD